VVYHRNEAYALKAIEIFTHGPARWPIFLKTMHAAGRMTGGDFANAAEILHATYPAWRSESLAELKRMLLTVYVPLIRMYYPRPTATGMRHDVYSASIGYL